MPSLGQNRIVRHVGVKQVFADIKGLLTSSISINQGDLCMYDSSAHTVRKVTSGDLGTNFLGIMDVAVSSGKLASPYTTDVDAAAAASAIPGPWAGVVAKLVLKTGDALVAGGPVYLDVASGSFHVTSTQAMSTVAVGRYQGAAITSATAGQQIEVMLLQNVEAGI